MIEKPVFTEEERQEVLETAQLLKKELEGCLIPGDEDKIHQHIINEIESEHLERDIFGLNPVVNAMGTAYIAVTETSIKRDGVMAVLLHDSVAQGHLELEQVEKDFGGDVAKIIKGIIRVSELYKKNPVIESDNFRDLLITFADDMRVILIMTAGRVNIMRRIRDTQAVEARQRVAEEASYLYAPIAHKLGLYKIKSELEDLSLKYLEHDAYYMIKDKLNATKRTRDAYIDQFIVPVKERLEAMGLKFKIKGRTKSIHSIWQKMKRQGCEFEGIYDLFAIRIILDSPEELEKMQCWQVYSVVTDMYQPNPKRLRDWLSMPKSNGYESLHITVLGPEKKWVEVQIRTERMDKIAEYGLAAHWKYKGVKGEMGLDEWLNNIRCTLESSDNRKMMDQFTMELYDDEVFAFTPAGDLLKFPKGATILDFAYRIHSNVGDKCVGAVVDGKNLSIRDVLHSGDQIEIITSQTQKPKADWLGIVKTSRAKAKIQASLKERQAQHIQLAKEKLERRFKNRKVDVEESIMSQVVDKMGYKKTTDFYLAIADDVLDVNDIVDRYKDYKEFIDNPSAQQPITSAKDFTYEKRKRDEKETGSKDILQIDENLNDIEYSLAKCCNPVRGDKIFGFVTASGVVKIHRCDCKNAPELRRRFGYRIVDARWSNKDGAKDSSTFQTTIRVVGNDDIKIMNNVTSLLSTDNNVEVRNMNINCTDGIFSCIICLMIKDTNNLNTILKKLKNVKGVKQVIRL